MYHNFILSGSKFYPFGYKEGEDDIGTPAIDFYLVRYQAENLHEF